MDPSLNGLRRGRRPRPPDLPYRTTMGAPCVHPTWNAQTMATNECDEEGAEHPPIPEKTVTRKARRTEHHADSCSGIGAARSGTEHRFFTGSVAQTAAPPASPRQAKEHRLVTCREHVAPCSQLLRQFFETGEARNGDEPRLTSNVAPTELCANSCSTGSPGLEQPEAAPMIIERSYKRIDFWPQYCPR